MARSLPYEIDTPRLLLRCWEIEDASALKEAIDSSLDMLRVWMPWAHHEPENLEKKIERIHGFRADFAAQKSLSFGIFKPAEKKVIGVISINWRVSSEVADFGYWLRADEINQGYATEAVLGCMFASFYALTNSHVEISCDPANERSAAIPSRLGYTALPPSIRKTADNRDRIPQVWQMDRPTFDHLHGTKTGFSIRDVQLNALNIGLH